jgi:glycosyltransferase involved in cell wall biosynthesis
MKMFYWDQARLMKTFELNALQKADFITSISSKDIEQFKADLPDASFFLSTAGADIKENPSLVRKSGTILAVSNWRWKPNLDGLRWFLNEVWPSVIRNYPEVRLKVAGEGLSDSFTNNYHSKNVDFLGFVDDIDTLRLTSSIFVAPLLSGSGMKLKVLEALAAGLPTVTTDFGAQGIDMVDGTHYLHADTSNQFIHALNTLMENDQLRKDLSENGRKQIRDNYSWEKKVKELSGFLNSIS